MAGKPNYLPWVALVAVYLLWGSTFIAIRVAVSTIPPFLMAGSRYVVAGLALASLQWLVAKPRPALPSWPQLGRIAVIGVLLLTIGNSLLCFAETKVESGTAALLVACVPIWMLLFDALRERRAPGWASVAGLVLGSAGMALLVGKSAGPAGVVFAVLIVTGTVAWALGSIYARGRAHHPLTASLEMFCGGVGSLVVGLALGEAHGWSVASASAQSGWAMLYLITAGAMVGYTAYAYCVRTLPTATVATYAYVNPVVAVALGALLLHEAITFNIVAGGIAIVASVALILLGNRRPRDLDAAELPEEAAA